MQVVILKGLVGLGDRLRALNVCLQYCIMYNAYLCIDWNDAVWDDDFFYYFELSNVQLLSKSDTLQRAKTGSIFPSMWTAELLEKPLHFNMGGEGCSFTTKQGYIPADVIVCNSSALYDSDCFLRHSLKLQDALLSRVQPYIAKARTLSLLIHLRMTDKPSNIVEEFQKYYATLPEYYKTNVAIISDMQYEWDIPPFRENASVYTLPPSQKGRHTYTAEELAPFGLSKRQMNIETIIDFFALCSAHHALGMSASVFYTLARQLYPLPE